MRQTPAILAIVLCLLAAAVVSGCASESAAIGKTVGMLVSSSDPTAQATLRPDYRYLRATVDGRTVLLVLGYVEPHPGGNIDVWYSAEHEVIKLQHGHIIATAGLATDWREVRFVAPPDWHAMAAQQTTTYTRERDEMPGYHFGIREVVTARPIAAPGTTLIKAIDPASLRWIEESAQSQTPNAVPLPPARFAFDPRADNETVIYSEQCLSPSLCLALQSWPVVANSGQ
ncbi:MAG: YjbF family lipoprotein [Rhodocyclaceae bacterium]|nr:YjbF family lipoprotein [Rhodocyclaceae bacterium]